MKYCLNRCNCFGTFKMCHILHHSLSWQCSSLTPITSDHFQVWCNLNDNMSVICHMVHIALRNP